MLNKARQLGEVYNWADAAPLFAEAERLYAGRPASRNALFAKLGRIRSTMERVSLPETSAWLAGELETNPLLKNEDDLRLLGLIVKGDIDGELNAGPMRRSWEAVRDLAQKLRNDRWINRANGEIGFTAFLEGDLATARQMIGAALLKAMLSKDFGAEIRYLAAVGTGMVMMGAPEDAQPYLEKALKAAEAHPEVGYQFLVHEGRLLALKAVAKWKEARQVADEMLEQARAKEKRVKECQVLITASAISSADRDYSRAIGELERAISLARAGGYPRLLADAQTALAEVYRTEGDLARAEAMAAAAALQTQTSGELYLIPGRFELLARLQVLRGKYASANSVYTQAADFMDAMLANVPNAATKSGLITVMSNLYSGHFSLLADHFRDAASAYAVVERARGRITMDLLRSGIRPNPVQTREIERQISRLHLQLMSARTPSQVRRVREAIFRTEQTRWLASGVSATRPTAEQTVPLVQLRKMLRPDELVLEYVLADQRSYCLAIASDGARIVTLPARSVVEGMITEYLAPIRAKRAAPELARRLHEAILGPVPGLKQHTRLIVVPDGRLHLLPFDALSDSAGRYLIETHTTTYAPSASALYLLRNGTGVRKPANGLLAVGGVPYDSGASPKTAFVRKSSPAALGNLPGSHEEAIAAAGSLPNLDRTLLTGVKATEAAFKAAQLGTQRAIHVAAHGVADELHPDRAAIILLSDPPAGEDGILQGLEIVQLRLNADLVVLSACETAAGRLLGQEGIGTLSRAFQLAGARSVLSTLWPVDDTFSLNLMKRFYARLGSGETVAAALSGAKRELLGEFASKAVPYYWAGFILDGAADRTVNSNRGTGKVAYANTHRE